MTKFLPTSIQEGKQYYKDLSQFDVIFVTGDPYYDHPLSGVALLSRLLDKKGFKVGIIPQPEKNSEFQLCGTPKYFFCITSGLLDSSLANYTPMLRKRENVLVPEKALILYTQKIKQLFPNSMTVLGGVEATIRRFTHFDYRENKLRRGILNDTKADLLIHGNAERPLLNLLNKMKSMSATSFKESQKLLQLETIDGVSFRIKKDEIPKEIRVLPSYEECTENKEKFNLLTRVHYLLPDDPFIEPTGLGFIRHNRPAHPLREEEMDFIYEQPFTRELHPESKNLEFTKSMIQKIETSVVLGRGCWGSCSFCVIPLVQGKEVAQRSKESILKEIETIYKSGNKDINDLTLATLNMYGSHCELYDSPETIYSPIIEKDITVYNKTKYCNQQCVGCPKRAISDKLIPLLEGVEKLNKKYNGHLELRSAIRHDIILDQKELFRKIMQFVTRLKIAPEHISDLALKHMNKSNKKAFEEFLEEYKKVNEEQGTNKALVPYFIAAHPGTTDKDMEILKEFCDEHKIYKNLTQVFTPTPGTLSTSMYYTGENPITREKVHVPRAFKDKKQQKATLIPKEEHKKNLRMKGVRYHTRKDMPDKKKPAKNMKPKGAPRNNNWKTK